MASSRTATYSPNDVSVVITKGGASHVVSGFAEDSIVTIDRNSDHFELYTGADDTNTRIFKANSSGTITISLQQTSASNDVLSQLHIADVDTRDSSGLFSFMVKDNSGRSSYFAEEAYIAVMPNSAYGNSMQLREWVIHCTRMTSYIGGNAKFSPEDQQTIEQLGGVVGASWQS